jgi:hypothetical protein
MHNVLTAYAKHDSTLLLQELLQTLSLFSVLALLPSTEGGWRLGKEALSAVVTRNTRITLLVDSGALTMHNAILAPQKSTFQRFGLVWELVEMSVLKAWHPISTFARPPVYRVFSSGHAGTWHFSSRCMPKLENGPSHIASIRR